MILPDVNVLVYAFRREAEHHQRYATWLARMVAGEEELALHDIVLAGVARLVTNPRIFADPAPMPVTLEFLARVRTARRARWLPPGDAAWTELDRLAQQDRGLPGNLVPGHVAGRAGSHSRLPHRHRRPRLRPIPRHPHLRPRHLIPLRPRSGKG